MTAVLERARDALQHNAWAEALDLFRQLDHSRLGPGDLEAMADAAWWCCLIDESLAARQKAYAGYVEAGDVERAGYTAWFIALDYGMKGDAATESGWIKRAQRHLADRPDCVERGFLALTEADNALRQGDRDEARRLAELAMQLGERCRSLDLQAMGIQTLGRALIARGEVAEGMSLLDEAMTLVIGGELSPLFTGYVYCNVIAACMERADLARANEWTEAAVAWCGSISDLTPYHGMCRIHRVEIAVLRAQWEQAEADALRTVQEMKGLEQHVVAEALYAIGETHLRRGDPATAQAWFTRAQEMGRDPQPGLAAIRMAQGKLDAAAAGIRLSLASTPEPTLQRARLLAMQVEISIASQDLVGARKASAALDSVVDATPSTLLDAIASGARAALHLAADEPELALQDGRAAWSLWQRLKLPYFAAQARMIVGLAARQQGDADRAQVELEAARATFERLGAPLDARVATEHLRRQASLPAGLSGRELEVLRLVAAGKTNREVAAALVISQHTVSRHLENIFRKLDVSSRAAAAAFAVEHSLV